MKHSLCLIAFIYFPVIAFCQPAFEQGYFVDGNDQRIECFIKMEDWTKKPTLDYMTNRGEPVQSKPLSGIKEFAINNQIKMVKAKVNLDISSDDVNLLSLQKEPEWIEDNLFLTCWWKENSISISIRPMILRDTFSARERHR